MNAQATCARFARFYDVYIFQYASDLVPLSGWSSTRTLRYYPSPVAMADLLSAASFTNVMLAVTAP